MPAENLRKTGNEMEEIAVGYLCERGVRILERNYKSREAEIDIIGEQDRTLLFVEVKARRSGKKSGSALEAVGPAKQKRICRCADFYMHEKGIDPYSEGIRFDVIAITAGTRDEQPAESAAAFAGAAPAMKDENLRILWIPNAFPYIPYSRTKPHWRVW